MDHDVNHGEITRPPLRKFLVRIKTSIRVDPAIPGPSYWQDIFEDHTITAHLVFDNNDRGEGLIFRRYYDDSVRTEKVAQFMNWEFYKEIDSNG